MKDVSRCAVLLLCIAFSTIAHADGPIAGGLSKDWLPAVAYNSTNHEYLVAWAEEVFNGVIWVNWVFAQRLGEDGTLLGSAFVVFNVGVNPAVAYNSAANEYLVAFNPGGGFVGQRVSNTGALIGGPTALMNGVSDGRLVYNSITGQYLFVGAVLVETPAGSGYYDIQISSCKIGADGQALGLPLLVDSRPHGYQPPEPAFAVAYAPIQSTETPYGRYLLAIGRGVVLEMLNSDGAPIDIVHDPDHPNQHYREIPFKTWTPSGGEFNVDVAYGDQSGYSMTGPAFLVVWADQNNRFNAQSWSGIWGGFLDATRISYLTTDAVSDHSFRISAIADHWAYDQHVESWRPKTAYNQVSGKFFVAWRETPGTSQDNDTKVNHIRGAYVFERDPATNVIISATSGTEDPTRPALAASTASEHALVVWQDSRNLGSTNLDVYGSIQKVADAVPPPPPTTTHMVINTLDSGPGSLRQAILDANARSGKDTIAFIIPGSGPHTIMPLTPLPPLTDPVVIDGYTQPGSRANTNALKDPDNAILEIVLDGTVLKSVYPRAAGLEIDGGNSLIRGLVMRSFGVPRRGGATIMIYSNGGNIIEGNYVETDVNGLAGYESQIGILIYNAPNNMIGGTEPEARNIIFGTDAGVYIMSAGASGNTVAGNYIGVDATGNGVLGTPYLGIMIHEAPSNTIGGMTAGAGNVIGGFGSRSEGQSAEGYCVRIIGDTAKGNTVAGNLIGTNATGSQALENSEGGILIESDENTVGGTDPASRNIVSGNYMCGVKLVGGNNIIQGNYIGTDITGTHALPNDFGIKISGGKSNRVGGTHAGAGNVISGNHGCGIEITDPVGSNNRVEGNRIGTAADGMSALGNTGAGIVILNHAHHTTIGGSTAGSGNVIAWNGQGGVAVGADAASNRINGNSIYRNSRLGIDLFGGVEDSRGVTNNDLGDGDTGANSLQNFPIVGTVIGGSFLYLEGILNSTANAPFRIEFFASPAVDPPLYGEGRTCLGWIDITTDATGNAPFAATIGAPVPAGQSITATATDTAGNTSEFGIPVTVAVVEGQEVVTNTDDSGPGSLRQAILNANAKPGKDTIAFNIPGSGPHVITPASSLPVITDPVVIDGYTQPGSSPNTGGLQEQCNAVLQIVLDGTLTSALYGNDDIALYIHCGNSCVRGLVIQSFGGFALWLDGPGSNTIEGDFIGTDSDGLASRPNMWGVVIVSASYNTIGGIDPASRNVISGNYVTGITITGTGADHNLIRGNFIGVDATGRNLLSNQGNGVEIFNGVSNTIGGSVAGAGNVVARMVPGDTGNGIGSCIRIGGARARGNIVAGNLIGTTLTGTEPLACTSFGVAVFDSAKKNTIGGTNAGARNIISRCSIGSVYLLSDSNTVQGNYIGTDITGTQAFGSMRGIVISGSGNQIGGRSSNAGNLISGNVMDGIGLYSPSGGMGVRDNRIQGNRIGTQSDGTSPLGNMIGVILEGMAADNTVGDTAAGAGNIIAFNDCGVKLRHINVFDPISNRISGNSIYGSRYLGIDLVGGTQDSMGVTANDPADWDSGPNDLQNYPVLSSVVGGSSVQIQGTLNSSANAMFTLEFFATPAPGALRPGEGQTFLGTGTVQTDASGNGAFNVTLEVPVAAGRAITATATNYLYSTSEFSAPILVTSTGITEKGTLPTETVLMQNYPNPFNPTTTITYELPRPSKVKLSVYDMLGREVSVLVNERRDAGVHEVKFEASGLSSGVYLYRIQAGDVVQSKTLVLLK
jgi:hypothetical protein